MAQLFIYNLFSVNASAFIKEKLKINYYALIMNYFSFIFNKCFAISRKNSLLFPLFRRGLLG
jgi:hypothetical protein